MERSGAALRNASSPAIGRSSLASAPLCLSKKSIGEGMCTREELDELIRLLSETLPFESQGRVRMVSIIAKCALSLPRAHRHALSRALSDKTR